MVFSASNSLAVDGVQGLPGLSQRADNRQLCINFFNEHRGKKAIAHMPAMRVCTGTH